MYWAVDPWDLGVDFSMASIGTPALLERQLRAFASFRAVPPCGKPMRFASIPLIVYRNVFWPCLDIAALLSVVKVNKGACVLDVGSGCGVIGIYCALSGAGRVVAVDWNDEAVFNAQQNAVLNGVSDVFQALRSDVFDGLSGSESFDIILANLPFMNMKAADIVETSIWDTDLHANRTFLSQVRRYLKPGGTAYVTQASFGALDEVRIVAADQGWGLQEVSSTVSAQNDVFYAFRLHEVAVHLSTGFRYSY